MRILIKNWLFSFRNAPVDFKAVDSAAVKLGFLKAHTTSREGSEGDYKEEEEEVKEFETPKEKKITDAEENKSDKKKRKMRQLMGQDFNKFETFF